MSYTDLLTISMPVYERKDYFVNALESALNQTVKCRVIVVDNCSSHDFFKTICKEKGVEYFRNSENIGMARNFARGFELSDSKFVMNLQDDDELSPIYVESFLEAYEKHPNIDIFYPDFVRLTSEGKLPHKHVLPFGYQDNGSKIIEYGIRYKLGFPYMASAIKRTIVKGFHGNIEGSGSYDWMWIYSEADRFSFYGDSRQLYIFREHDMQDTRRNAIRYSFSIPYIYDKILRGKVSDPKLKKIASRNAFDELFHLRAMVGGHVIDEFLEKDGIYSNYLRDKLQENMSIKVIFLCPKGIVFLVHKTLKKLKVLA